ncbi:GSCFA domain-containing protein [Cruoricaptor ignavus]|uniref:GSCFA domain-containing protein n=1 Tax=Cruoricaptor ignavus TaxID=1118202 RepID=A0A7M1T1S3_9FLAO|nr:GSCFA domain-containing protein [Cruoricaptor ignavus]QOR73800.1 GSCFA domain-containing protein [Cruoricaptor ignavus]
MNFRTEVCIPDSENKIQPDDRIFSIGSCFASEISSLLGKGQLQVYNNPFGTLFSPYSVNQAVKRLHQAKSYSDEDLITFGGKFISLDHHSSFDTPYAHRTLERINAEIDAGNAFLQEARWVLITYGTSFIYEFLPKKNLVANCRKIPSKFFRKRLLSAEELNSSIGESVSLLRDICPREAQILLTVSPVRHTKDGFAENTLSKSKLITAIHEVAHSLEFCTYLPVYEIVMDDLRDYRFYAEDMIHPNNQAINYIFEKFGNAYFSDETMDFLDENFRIQRALRHRPTDPSSEDHQNLQQKIREQIARQQALVKHKIFQDFIND